MVLPLLAQGKWFLGMGKPLGLGAVKVEAALHLTDRLARYTTLFAGPGWATGERDDADAIHQNSVQAFERWILDDSVLNPGKADKLAAVSRIQMLLFLLSWKGPDKEKTRYLEIEHPVNDNEYKDRPVLPTPGGVMGVKVKPGSSASRPRVGSASRGSHAPRRTASVQSAGSPTGIVTYFNLKDGVGRVQVGDKEITISREQLAEGVRYLARNRKVTFTIVRREGKIHLKEIKPI